MSDENMLFATEQEQMEDGKQIDEIATRKFLTFQTDNLLFGIAAENVVEIITSHTITRVPMVPSYVRGIINLRGQTIPLIDMRLRLNIEPTDTDCIVVLNIDEMQIGILVDTVCQIIDIPEQSIRAVPEHNAQKYVSGMSSMPDGSGTMLVLDCHLLLSD
ncbi:MAG: chemotaxis protein CheW [Agathobaculum sp.]|uniref:chemotaxis protein CheW n=1 Tax=Agathobaculum sp. TaxID=2048138 RepID=UPI0025C3F73B|nr:chemotaxis protein CheW [Agathobaculum sp.]MCI7125737.1 chemotaxis protein CheW [Agathobaculum sp.]MDY3711630.1 chemotaxis protein CheW [Agathobaculum sp.]